MSIAVTDIVQLPPIATVAGSYPVTIPESMSSKWANDDWVFLAVSFGVTSGTATLSTASSGWTEVVENGITSGAKMAIYKAKVSGGTVADPTITASTGTGMWQGVMWVERGLDGTTPVLSTATAAAGSQVNNLTTGTLTPANNNAHVYYFAAVCSGSLIYTRFLDSEIVGEVLQSLDNGTVGQTIVAGSWQQGTAAATAKTLYASAAGRLGCITMALNDAVTTQRAQHASVDMTRIAWGGTFGNQHDGTLTPTVSSWNGNPTSRTIDGTAVSTTGGTVDLTSTSNTSNNEWGFYTAFASTLNADNWQGNLITLAADVDLSGGIFSVEFAPAAVNNAIGTKGWIIVFENNAGTEWAAYRLSSKVGLKAGKSYTIMIDLENAVPLSSELGDGVQSALDWTTVRKITPLVHRSGLAATSRTFLLKNLLFWRSVTLTGGSSDVPQTINYLRKAMQGWGYDGLVGGEAPAATLRCNTNIGNGTTPLYYDATGTLHAFPVAYNFISSREVNIPANALTLTIDASADDTINLTATAISATQEQNVVFAAGTDAGADYSTQGLSAIGVAFTGQTVAGPFIGATYSGCDTVAFGGADVTNATITDTTSTNAAASWDASGATADRCTIDGTGAAYAIELGTAVTAITLTNCTITAGSTDKVHVLKTTGTVTITISGTTSLVAGDVTSAGATVDIIAPVEYQSVTLSNYTTGSRIQIYDTTNSVELYNDIPAAAPQTLWTDSVAASTSGARDIRVRCAYVSGVTAKNFIEAAIGTVAASGAGIALSYRVNQSDDHVYVANGVDGSLVTGITIVEGATDRVQISIAGGSVTWPQIYAYQCYWLFDVTGITDDGAFINAPDTANYTLTGFKIKNTHATNALVITGGYGVDSTGSASVLYDTTGTSIFPAPAHVVPYQTTGTYAITGDISTVLAAIPSDTDNAAAVLAAAQTTPIHSDVRKVVGITVDGTGTDGDPWGPV